MSRDPNPKPRLHPFPTIHSDKYPSVVNSAPPPTPPVCIPHSPAYRHSYHASRHAFHTHHPWQPEPAQSHPHGPAYPLPRRGQAHADGPDVRVLRPARQCRPDHRRGNHGHRGQFRLRHEGTGCLQPGTGCRLAHRDRCRPCSRGPDHAPNLARRPRLPFPAQ